MSVVGWRVGGLAAGPIRISNVAASVDTQTPFVWKQAGGVVSDDGLRTGFILAGVSQAQTVA